MSKLTLHDKVREGFMAAVTLKNYAKILKRESESYEYIYGIQLAEEMNEKAEEYIKKLE